MQAPFEAGNLVAGGRRAQPAGVHRLRGARHPAHLGCTSSCTQDKPASKSDEAGLMEPTEPQLGKLLCTRLVTERHGRMWHARMHETEMPILL